MTAGRMSILGAIGLVALFALFPPSGPTRFVIPKGEIWAGPTWLRFRFWGTPTTRHAWTFGVRFTLDEVPVGTSFKIIGLSDLTTRTNRIKLYGWQQAPSITHEDSDRFVASVADVEGKRGAWITAYAYRAGYGGITTSRGVELPDSLLPLSRRLGFVASGEWAELYLDRGSRAAEYTMRADSWPEDSLHSASIPMLYRPTRLQDRWSGFAHASSGPRQPVSPADIVIEFEKRRPR